MWRWVSPALAAASGAAALCLAPSAPVAECEGLKRRTTVGSLAGLRRRVDCLEAKSRTLAPTLAALSKRLAACERDVSLPSAAEAGAKVGAGGSTLEQGVGKGGLPTLTVRHASGASAELYLFGATVTSLRTATGEELLFVSEEARFNGEKAIRGGIPLVFPKFGAGPCAGCDALPSHGFARTSNWTPQSFEVEADGSAVLTLVLASPTGVEGWVHPFHCEYEIKLGAGAGAEPLLTTSFRVTNTGTAPFTYQSLQHTYLRVADVASTTIRGFEGSVFAGAPYDFSPGGGSACDVAPETRITAEKDAIYVDMDADVVLQPAYGAAATVVGRSASVTQGAGAGGGGGGGTEAHAVATDCVLWNPWVAKAKRTTDLGDDEFKRFVCVEPGIALAPGGGMVLLPGETGCLVQTIAQKEA